MIDTIYGGLIVLGIGLVILLFIMLPAFMLQKDRRVK